VTFTVPTAFTCQAAPGSASESVFEEIAARWTTAAGAAAAISSRSAAGSVTSPAEATAASPSAAHR
jgi:hypothetical protein